MKTTVALLIIAASTAFAQPQYFISTTDSLGYTIQNVFIDFTTLDQPQDVGRIAFNSVICRGDSVLVRPSPVATLTVNLSAASADSVLSPVVSGSVSLAQLLYQRIAKFAVRDLTCRLPDSVTVKKITNGTVTTIKGYAR